MASNAPAHSSTLSRRSYVREQSPRELLANTFGLYWRHIGVLFLIEALPIFPFNFWDFYLQAKGGPLINPASILVFFLELVPFLAVTVAVSDICLGNRPGVLRSYARVFNRDLLPLAATYLALLVMLALGFIALVVPGLVLVAWFLFVNTVMVLERRYGRAAFARSKSLGTGFHWRNLGILGVLFLALVALLVTFLLVYEAAILLFAGLADPLIRAATEALFVALVSPLLYVGSVLLYYDLRARKEAYDSTALTEDLLR